MVVASQTCGISREQAPDRSVGTAMGLADDTADMADGS